MEQRASQSRNEVIEETVKSRCKYLENELKRKSEEFNNLNKDFDKQVNELIKYHADISDLQTQVIKQQDNLTAKDEELKALNRLLDEKNNYITDIVNKHKDLAKLNESQTKEIDYLQTTVSKNQNIIVDYEERLNKALGHSRTVESKYEKVQQEIKKLTSASSICVLSPGRGDTLKRREEDINLLENQIKARDIKIKQLEKENARALTVIRELLKKETDDKDHLVGKYSTEDLAQRDKEIMNLKKELRVLKETFVFRPNEFKNSSSENKEKDVKANQGCEYEVGKFLFKL